jgi:ubiquinone/menaquinone biosynthesis C-methylase UbiE
VRHAHAGFVRAGARARRAPRLTRGEPMVALAPDPAAFRALEHAGWQGAARHYDDAFGSLTRQAVDPLLDSAEVRSGARTLDVASGPGYAAAAAAARGARVAALDFSSAMVEVARSQNPETEFREGDAEALPFPEGSFDAVVMNFGMLHLAQPERAVAEAFRVLRPGGRYAFTVWAKPEEAVGFGIILDAIRKHGNPDVPLPPGPPFFRFSDASECDKVLKVAGFRNVDVRKVPQVWRFSASGLLFEAFLAGSVRTQALLHAQSAQALAAIRDAVGRVAGEYENHGTVEIPMPAVLAAAGKP